MNRAIIGTRAASRAIVASQHLPPSSLILCKHAHPILQRRQYSGRDTRGGTKDIFSEADLFEGAAKDYLRDRPESVKKKVVDSPLQKLKNKHLADGYNQYIRILKNKFLIHEIKKEKLVDAAMLALPEPLRLEAEKTDWTPFPDFIHTPATLPPAKGYQGLELPLRNEL